MPTNIEALFESRPLGEIIEISNQERIEIIEKAEELFFSTSERHFDGGKLTPLFKGMIRSFIEIYARKESIDKFGKFSTMDLSVYEKAIIDVKKLLEEYSHNIEKLLEMWLNGAKTRLVNTFSKSRKIFEPYLLGELCDALYLDNSGAIAVLEELKNQEFVQLNEIKFNQNLLSLIT